MSVREKLQPVQDHRTGIPSTVLPILRGIGPHSSKQMLDVFRRTYDQLVLVVERMLEGQAPDGYGVIPPEDEERCAEVVAHQIIDLAFLHDRLSYAGLDMGEFPFDDLADKIMPKEADHDSDQ